MKSNTITFHLTGFGPFHGVDDNPTTKLVETLRHQFPKYKFHECAKLASFDVCETSAVGALSTLTEIMQQHQVNHHRSTSQDATTVFLHLGVDGGAQCFALENSAYNEAHFRCPDERGWTPMHQTIVPKNGTTSHTMRTELPLQKIKEELTGQKFDVRISEDPGRFLCNYIYYQSLHFSKINRTHSLFVHVPPFDEVGEEIQLAFVVALINAISNHVGNN